MCRFDEIIQQRIVNVAAVQISSMNVLLVVVECNKVVPSIE